MIVSTGVIIPAPVGFVKRDHKCLPCISKVLHVAVLRYTLRKLLYLMLPRPCSGCLVLRIVVLLTFQRAQMHPPPCPTLCPLLRALGGRCCAPRSATFSTATTLSRASLPSVCSVWRGS
ncbi:unnamed protein product [Discosporangium mesarthrocarpum]